MFDGPRDLIRRIRAPRLIWALVIFGLTLVVAFTNKEFNDFIENLGHVDPFLSFSMMYHWPCTGDNIWSKIWAWTGGWFTMAHHLASGECVEAIGRYFGRLTVQTSGIVTLVATRTLLILSAYVAGCLLEKKDFGLFSVIMLAPVAAVCYFVGAGTLWLVAHTCGHLAAGAVWLCGGIGVVIAPVLHVYDLYESGKRVGEEIKR
jgi:hypothetical protein